MKRLSYVIAAILIALSASAGGAAEPKLKFSPQKILVIPADLIVVKATLSKTSPRPGEKIQVKATIKNRGGRTLSGAISVTAKPDSGKTPKAGVTNNLNAGKPRVVSVNYTVPFTAKNGNKICFKVSVSSSSEASSRRWNNTLREKDRPCLTVKTLTVRFPRGIPKTKTVPGVSKPGVTIPRPPTLTRHPDVKISSVRPEPRSRTVFPPRGVLSLKATVTNSGTAKATRVKLSLKLARKPLSGSPTWEQAADLNLGARIGIRMGNIRAGGSETAEFDIKTTGQTIPGKYLYRFRASAQGETATNNNTKVGEFKIGFRRLSAGVLAELKVSGEDPRRIRPPWVLDPNVRPTDPSGGDDLPVGNDDWGDWGGGGGGDWGGDDDWGGWGAGDGGDWDSGGWDGGDDWGSDWGEEGGGGGTGPRVPGAVGQGPSGGMNLAELKSTGEPTGPKFVSNRIVLFARPKGNQSAEDLLNAVAKRYALSLVDMVRLESVGAAMGIYKIVGRRDVMSVVDKIQQDGQVQAQPNYYFEALAADPKAKLQYGPAMLGIPRLKGKLTGKGVKVAILDTGVDARHEDLKGRVTGYRDLVKGKSKPTPDLHGTAVAGIIAAMAGNGKGGAGIAPRASLLVIKVIKPKSSNSLKGTSTTFRIARGLDAAMVSGARVINLSLGGPEDKIVGNLVDTALKKNIVVVAAAGNSGPQGRPPYPASHPGVIAVTAIDKKTRPYRAATQGDFIALSAPGVEVFTTAPGNQYRMVSGTSFAAAHVSGVAALLLEQAPRLSVDQIRAALEKGVVDIGPKGKDPLTGQGRLSACLAIRAATKRDVCGKKR